jgi:hypothetical protein
MQAFLPNKSPTTDAISLFESSQMILRLKQRTAPGVRMPHNEIPANNWVTVPTVSVEIQTTSCERLLTLENLNKPAG